MIEEIEKELGGFLSLAARNLQTGETHFYKADRKVQTASVIKLPMLVHVALEVQEGRLAWDEPLALTEAEKVDGSGILMLLTAGLTLTLRDVCTLMIVLSDNTATNMVIERLGIEPINARMRALGLKETTLFRKAYSPDTPQSRRYGLGVTTAREMLRLVTLLVEGKIGSAETSADIVSILAGQHYRDGIPRLLPADWQYAGKTGAVDHVRNDVGFVTAPDGRRFGLAVFCQQIPVVLWTADNPGLIAIARLARRLVGLDSA
ncbi:MAG TPA: serine hydrolase [Chthonomonadaceae bacterium]|nr:serine hydrolase [Chthonomonadaceae bacterium]